MVNREHVQPEPAQLTDGDKMVFRLPLELRRAGQGIDHRKPALDAGDAVGADFAGQEAAALVGEFRLCVRNHVVEKLARQEKTK